MDGQPDYLFMRTAGYTRSEISKIEAHNERLKNGYTNCDIVPEMSYRNVHFKQCGGAYLEVFDGLEKSGEIDLRGLRGDAIILDEMLIDVNSEYFHRHGYQYVLEFYRAAYEFVVEKAGSEKYILSAVLHADERNVALSEKYGYDVWHYHLHVVYVPVVPKEIKYTKRWKDKEMRGKVRETVMQVSHSKKWASELLRDEQGQVRKDNKGKTMYDYSYSKLQTEFFEHMQAHDYTDVARGEVGSKRKRRETVDYKLEQDELRAQEATQKVAQLETTLLQKEDALNELTNEFSNYCQMVDEERELLSEIKDKRQYFDFFESCTDTINRIFDEMSAVFNQKSLLRNSEQERQLKATTYSELRQFTDKLQQICGYEYRNELPPEQRESANIIS